MTRDIIPIMVDPAPDGYVVGWANVHTGSFVPSERRPGHGYVRAACDGYGRIVVWHEERRTWWGMR